VVSTPLAGARGLDHRSVQLFADEGAANAAVVGEGSGCMAVIHRCLSTV
jgi:hypothetical protein